MKNLLTKWGMYIIIGDGGGFLLSGENSGELDGKLGGKLGGELGGRTWKRTREKIRGKTQENPRGRSFGFAKMERRLAKNNKGVKK